MKKMILMLMAMVVFGNSYGGIVWLPETSKQFDENYGYRVTAIYPAYHGLQTSAADNQLIFRVQNINNSSDMLTCSYVFQGESGKVMSDYAKSIYAVLLTAYNTQRPISFAYDGEYWGSKKVIAVVAK